MSFSDTSLVLGIEETVGRFRVRAINTRLGDPQKTPGIPTSLEPAFSLRASLGIWWRNIRNVNAVKVEERRESTFHEGYMGNFAEIL